MARLSGGKLTNLRCTTAGPGTHADGPGLYLQVRPGANGLTRSWVYRYATAGKETWLGLGPFPLISLAAARRKAADARLLRLEGHDPLAQRRNQRASLNREQAKQTIPTFDQCRDAYVASHQAGWRSVRHSREWARSLNAHVSPVFGSTPVDMIDTARVCKALEALWHSKTDTATRVRARIEAVLNWAQTRGYRAGENPARWRGHLANLLPARSKVAAIEHFAAMPYAEVPGLIAALRQREGISALALQFLVLTAARTGEVLGARWSEIDLAGRVWTIPAQRTKSGREHRVPLSSAAVAVLAHMQVIRIGEHVFPGQKRSALTETALYKFLRNSGCRYTVHGFRSGFRDWAAERTAYPREVIEQSLAHRTGNATELAYMRSDQLEKRRRLMADWAAFCETPVTSGEVIPIRA